MNIAKLCKCTFRPPWRQHLPKVPSLLHHPRNFSSTHSLKEEGVLARTLKKIPFLQFNKANLRAAGYQLYEAVADHLNYEDFFNKLGLPDTFYSWFAVTELHVWMVSVREMAEGEDGRLVRNAMVEALWNDVHQRVKQLGAGNPSMARIQIQELSEQFQAALLAYDEGLQSEDTVLAAALWRRFYQQGDVDPLRLDLLVRYVRKQLRLLDHQPRDRLMGNTMKWESLE